jgi:hypothetical protein
MNTTVKRPYVQVMDGVDESRAKRLQGEYGRVKWLVSWHKQDEGLWLARVSCPNWPETVEGVGQSRCLAIDSATRHLLDLMHKQHATEQKWSDANDSHDECHA